MGASLLVAVKDKDGPQLYLVDPSGTGLVRNTHRHSIHGQPSMHGLRLCMSSNLHALICTLTPVRQPRHLIRQGILRLSTG